MSLLLLLVGEGGAVTGCFFDPDFFDNAFFDVCVPVVPPVTGGRQAFRVMPVGEPWLEDDDWLLVEVA